MSLSLPSSFPGLIHPVYIEIKFLDKENNFYNQILEEQIGETVFLPPVQFKAQRGFPKTQAELTMVRGGDSPDSDGYFLLYKWEIRQKLNINDNDAINLEVFKSAVICKEEDYEVNYKIKNATPQSTYNYRTNFIKVAYEIPKTGD